MSIPTAFRTSVAAALLAACSPSDEELEKACFEKLLSDFDQYAIAVVEASKGKSWDNQIAASGLAVIARESAVAVAVIHSDDDRSACDYVSAGPYLQRK